MNARHRPPTRGRGMLASLAIAPLAIALGLAFITLAGALPAQADQRPSSWSQNWSQHKWSNSWSKSQWKRHSDWRHHRHWKHHRPRFSDGFRHCFNCGSRFVFNGPGFKGGVFFSRPGFVVINRGFIHNRPGFIHNGPGFVVRQPGFIVRQPGFIVRQPTFFNQPSFVRRQLSVQPRAIASPPVPAIRIIRPGMMSPGIRIIRPGAS